MIADSQPEIDPVLADYGVPLLDEQGQLKRRGELLARGCWIVCPVYQLLLSLPVFHGSAVDMLLLSLPSFHGTAVGMLRLRAPGRIR